MKVLEQEPLADYTTFQIGGRAEFLYVVESMQDLRDLFSDEGHHPEDFYIIGRGSNLLLKDGVITNPFLHLAGRFESVTFEGETVRAGAGVPLPQLSVRAARQGLSGLEWAAGIPGTVGGAVAMNAGAFDHTIADRLTSLRFFDTRGRIQEHAASEVDFDYRYCSLRDRGFILEAELRLERTPRRNPLEKTQELLAVRHREQPVGARSAGCVFQNPDGDSAGRLIDKASLKDENEGPVYVSSKHANYFINRGGARRIQVLRLIERVRERVFKTFGVELDLEIQIYDE